VRRYAAFLAEDEVAAVPLAETAEPPLPPPPPRRRRVRSILLFGGAALAVAVATFYLLSEVTDSDEGARPEAGPTTASIRRATVPRPSPPPPATPAPKPRQRPRTGPAVRLGVTAASGDSWVDARADSPTGRVLFQGLLAEGRTLSLSGRRLWMRVGAASHLAFTLNGRRANAGLVGTVNVIVTRQGIRPA
jgi:hypothetical protein